MFATFAFKPTLLACRAQLHDVNEPSRNDVETFKTEHLLYCCVVRGLSGSVSQVSQFFGELQNWYLVLFLNSIPPLQGRPRLHRARNLVVMCRQAIGHCAKMNAAIRSVNV
jgi:hypothetical protein